MIFPYLACAVLALPLLAADAPTIHGIDPTNMDKSVKPGDDFFEYANGQWIGRTEIPADRGSIGVFTTLEMLSNKRTAALIDEIVKSGAKSGASTRKIGDLYSSFMNEAGIEAKGLAPIRSHLAAIAAIQNRRDLARALGETLRADVDALNNTNFHTANLFGLWVAPGFSDSEHYTAYLLQGGLQMPDREYYLADTEPMRIIREKYQAHVSSMLKLAGLSDTDARSTRLIALEHAIAEKHTSLADNDDIHGANNVWKPDDFAAKAPGLDWPEYFRAAGLAKQPSFIVWQPAAFSGESALVAATDLTTWKDWLAFHLIDAYAAVLPKSFAEARFDFFGKTLSGTPDQRPRWQRAVAVVNATVGDEVGKIYAQRYFPPKDKAEVQTIVANIVAAFRKRIDGLNWMDASTKAEAQAKLDTLYVGVGYGESWHDYSGLEIKAGDIFGNLWRSGLFEYHRQLARLGAPTDRKEWSMTPQTVNAVNLPLQNALNFPAAILQPPFFDPEAGDAANYGAIGSIIGHEISHTFDSEGAAFDSKGRVRNWWTAADLAHFEASTAKLAAQYDTYKPFPDLTLNGKQTLAENIADVAGLAAAYDAYFAKFGSLEVRSVNGFTLEQQFFLAYAQSRASKSREAALRQQVATDSHSPAEFRTDTVRNIDAWYPNFHIQPGDKLYLAPKDRVKIW